MFSMTNMAFRLFFESLTNLMRVLLTILVPLIVHSILGLVPSTSQCNSRFEPRTASVFAGHCFTNTLAMTSMVASSFVSGIKHRYVPASKTVGFGITRPFVVTLERPTNSGVISTFRRFFFLHLRGTTQKREEKNETHYYHLIPSKICRRISIENRIYDFQEENHTIFFIQKLRWICFFSPIKTHHFTLYVLLAGFLVHVKDNGILSRISKNTILFTGSE